MESKIQSTHEQEPPEGEKNSMHKWPRGHESSNLNFISTSVLAENTSPFNPLAHHTTFPHI